MANELTLIFTAEKIQTLLDQNPDKIVIRTTIEAAMLEDGAQAGVVRVYADARLTGNPEPLATITGCPDPPCSAT